MKIYIFFLIILVSFVACNKKQEVEPKNVQKLKKPIDVPYLKGNWRIVNSDFKGDTRSSGMVGFSLDDKCYFGLGNQFPLPTPDLWEYDPQNNKWTQKATFPSEDRHSTISFQHNNKAYYGLGYSYRLGEKYFKDIWVYDNKIDKWSKIADIPLNERACAFAFVIKDKVYIGGGYIDIDSTLINRKTMVVGRKSNSGTNKVIANYQDLWEYDLLLGTWQQKNNIPSFVVMDNNPDYQKGFAINGKGYVLKTNGFLFLYDEVADKWLTQKSCPKTYTTLCPVGIGGLGGSDDSCIEVVGNKVYVITPYSSDNIEMYYCGGEDDNAADYWEYNADNNKWQKIAEPRLDSLVRFQSSCVVKDKVYFLNAIYKHPNNNSLFSFKWKPELWELSPEK